MRIAIIVEGKTERVFKEHLRLFLETKLAGKMPVLDFFPQDGRIPKGNKLRRAVENLLGDRKQPADAVIALTDVYTGCHLRQLEGRWQRDEGQAERADQIQAAGDFSLAWHGAVGGSRRWIGPCR